MLSKSMIVTLLLLSLVFVAHSVKSCQQGSVLIKQQCVSCSILSNTIVSTVIKSNTCMCKVGYKWQPKSKECLPKPTASPPKFPKKKNSTNITSLLKKSKLVISKFEGLCNQQTGFIIKNNSCLNCKAISNTTGFAVGNTTCLCTQDLSWWQAHQVCICWSRVINQIQEKTYCNSGNCRLCSTVSNQTEANFCRLCLGGPFGVSRMGCHNCSSLPNTIGAAMSNSIYGSQYGECICKAGYRFSFKQGQCICDTGFYMDETGCQNCSKLATKLLIASCSICSNPYIFDSYAQVCKLGKIIANFNATSNSCNKGYDLKVDPNDFTFAGCFCSFAQERIFYNGKCVVCQTLASNFPNIDVCISCDNAEGLHQGIVECIYCSGITHATGEATPDGCTCQPNFYWNQITAQCECDHTMGFFTFSPGICFDCNKIQNTILPAFKAECRCSKGYVWNSVKKICQCNIKGGLAFLWLNQCISCEGMVGSTEKAKNNMCICTSIFTWNPISIACQCNTTLSYISNYLNTCTNCLFIKNSNGFGSQYGCSCKNGYIWNSTSLTCDCGQNYFVNGNHCFQCSSKFSFEGTINIDNCLNCSTEYGFAMVDGICYLCSSQANSLGIASSHQCLCQNYRNTWIPAYGACVCNSYFETFTVYNKEQVTCQYTPWPYNSCNSSNGEALQNLSSNLKICSICSTISFSTQKANGSQCVCIPGYKWNTNNYPFSCTCSISNGGYKNGTICSNCSNLNSTGSLTKSGCLACDYRQGFLYDKLNDACILCSSIPHTDGTATSKGCSCNSGWVWNPSDFTCVFNPCTENYVYNPLWKRCECDFTVAIIDLNNNCVRCDSYSNSDGIPMSIDSCGCKKGYQWSNLLNNQNSDSRCICPTCPCSETSFTLGEANGVQVCFECNTVVDYVGVNKTLQQCLCPSSLVWNWNPITLTGYCDCNNTLMISSNNGAQCICNPLYTLNIDGDCFDCRNITGGLLQDGTILFVDNTTQTPSCKCKQNFNWNAQTLNCQCSDPFVFIATSSECNCKYPYVYNGKGACICDKKTSIVINGSCISCSSINSSNGQTSTTKSNSCQCIQNLIFSINEELGPVCNCGTAMNMNSNTTKCQCKSQNCSNLYCDQIAGFIQYKKHCLSCKLFKYSSGSAYSHSLCSPRNSFSLDQQTGQIKCKTGQFLNGYKCQSCKYQSKSIDKLNCNKVYPPFAYSLMGVVDCSTIPFYAGVSNSRCLCQKGYFFNYKIAQCQCDFYQGYFLNGSQCVDCKKGNATILTNCLACSPPFYFDNQVCQLSKFIPNINNTSPTLECSKGYELKINPITNKILSCACSAAQRYYLNGTLCTPCALIKKLDPIYIEYCEGCNNDFGFHLGLVECINCSSISKSTGNATKEGCVCQNKYFWNAITAKCECDQSQGYFAFNQNCFSCNNIPNTELPALNSSCLCKIGYIWVAATQTCDCDITGGYFGTPAQCITCLTILNTVDKTKKNNACSCNQGSYWDSNKNVCKCDNSLNFAEDSYGCVNCTDVVNSVGSASLFGCACSDGFVWSYSLGICHCSYGYYRKGDNCTKCSQQLPSQTTLELCQACSNSEGGYSLNGDICYHCPSLGSSKMVSNDKNILNQCLCLDNMTQVWNANLGRCVCNIYQFQFPLPDDAGQINCTHCEPLSCSSGQCSNVSNIYYNYLSNTCKQCNQVTIQPIDFFNSYSFNYECQCKPGYSINYKVYPYTCTCDFYQGYYFDFDQCLNCRGLPATGKITNQGCLVCDNSQGFYLDAYNSICIKCKGIFGSNGLANPTGCGCTAGYWDPKDKMCIDITCQSPYIFNPLNLSCDCDPRISIKNSTGSCLLCSSLAKGTGNTVNNISTGNLVCQCTKGYSFDQDDCICQWPLIYNETDSTCICQNSFSFTIAQFQCFYCYSLGVLGTGQIDPNNPNACQCQIGYQFKWNNATKRGICDCPIGYKFDSNGVNCTCDTLYSLQIEGNCIPCASIRYTNNKSSDGGLTCGCIAPFKWDPLNNSCTCNSTAAIAFDKGKAICVVCSSAIFAIRKFDDWSCTCSEGLIWSPNGYCQCDENSAMIITATTKGKTFKCLSCDSAINATAKLNRTACECLPTLVWLSTKCGCSTNAFSITVDGAPKCVTCNASIYAKSKSTTKPVCVCISSLFVWNATINSCVCVSKQSVPFKKGNSFLCITCASAINSNGRASPLECNCTNSDFVWSPQFGKCICADNSSVLVNGNKCILCDSSIYASGIINSTTCKCQPALLSWQNTGMCGCSGSADVLLSDELGNIQCLTCNASIQAIGRLNSTTCRCKTGFEWQNRTCVCMAGTIYTYTTALTCYDCKNSNQQTMDYLTCLCADPKIWDNIKKTCVTCGTSAISKSTTQTFGGIACGCIAGYLWDIMTNTCIKTCTLASIYCMNCNKIPNVNTKTSIVGNSKNYRNLKGGIDIQTIYKQMTSNYDTLAGFSCVCSTGFLWDDYRKRCFSSEIPLS